MAHTGLLWLAVRMGRQRLHPNSGARVLWSKQLSEDRGSFRVDRQGEVIKVYSDEVTDD